MNPIYPGVYIEEIPSGGRTIVGVATSITAFVGRAERGVVGEPTVCRDFGEFDHRFGGLWGDGPMSYAVDDFFTNGGVQAMIVRLFAADEDDGIANLAIGGLRLRAVSEGSWGNRLSGQVSHPDDPASAVETAGRFGLVEDDLFDLTVDDAGSGAGETFRNVTVNISGGAVRIDRVLTRALRSCGSLSTTTAIPTCRAPGRRPRPRRAGRAAMTDRNWVRPTSLVPRTTGPASAASSTRTSSTCSASRPTPGVGRSTGRFERVRPSSAPTSGPFSSSIRPKTGTPTPTAPWPRSGRTSSTPPRRCCRSPMLPMPLSFPRLRKRDPLRGGQMDVFVPCGAVAGVIARTDASRGVWKAPAGTEAAVAAVEELTVELTESENGLLNPIAVNCLRFLPHIGLVVWGSRTLRGSDQLSDEYKYLPVRRLALFIEQSLYRGTDWVVFEPNDEPLWAQIRLSVGAVMQSLFRQGAFAGASPKDAYFVKCDRETMTQDDIDRGFVNIVVGFAPLKPAEFVVISIRQVHSA